MKNYYLRSFASLLVLTFSFLSLNAQDVDCDCEGETYDPVCVVGPFGFTFELDNACIAECLGFEITDENCDEWEDPWADCDCAEPDPDSEGICALIYDEIFQDSLVVWVPSECFISCWYNSEEYEIVECEDSDWPGDDGDCPPNDWVDCDCEEPTTDEGICFIYFDELHQDSLEAWAPNECFINCWYDSLDYEIIECTWVNPWGDCDCEEPTTDEGICFSYIDEFFDEVVEGWAPSECFIDCWYGIDEYEIIECQDWDDPWGDCDCEEPTNNEGICFTYFDVIFDEVVEGWAPSACFIACWYGIDEYEVTECQDWDDPWGDCDCEEPTTDEGICFLYYDEVYQDSLYGWAPSECFIACWYDSLSYTITECTDYDGPTVDGELDSCLLLVDLENFETLQSLLLELNEVCDIELPECILEAPIFETDEEFIAYIEENCDDMGDLDGGMMDELLDITGGTDSDEPINENALIASDIDLRVKSNPTDSEIIYTVDSKIEGPATVSAVDLNGNVFNYSNIRLQKGANDFTMDITAITSQIFVLHVQTDKEYKTIKVFVE